jgi:polyisoprenoid-binding protein YceI
MSTQVDIPGYVVGTWAIDTARSDVSFQIRQLGLSTVRGGFGAVEGTIVTAADPRRSSVSAVIRTASVTTDHRRRDKHLRTRDFLDVEQHATITFASTGLRTDGDAVLLDGDLTIRGITRPVTLTVTVEGFGAGRDGLPVARFSARTEVNRDDYGVIRGVASAVIDKKVTVTLAVEAVKQD